MGRLSGFRYRVVARKLKSQGFDFFREARGSHEIWYSSLSGRYTTLPRHRGDIPEGTLRAILKQAGITIEDFLDV